MDQSKKNIFVIGGTGRTGSILIPKLIGMGYNITSITRTDPLKCKDFGTNHKWVQYDLYTKNDQSESKLSEYLKNHDAVISCLGGKKGSPTDLYYNSYINLLSGMHDAGVNRLIAVTADGTHTGHGFFFKYVVKKVFLSSILKDTEKTEEYFKKYDGPVQWTLIRPFRLLDGEKGKYRTALENEYPKEGGKWTWESFTGDVAQFCIDELNQEKFIKKLVSTGV
jgi:putative NADH-flavin reductase